MKTILISPHTKLLRWNMEHLPNPKSYPYWDKLVELLWDNDWYMIQIGLEGEDAIGANEFRKNMRLKDIVALAKECDARLSIDNFFPHLMALHNIPTVVIWGTSWPEIFGYDIHTNILKDKKYLRQHPLWFWEQAKHRKDAFVYPEEIIRVLNGQIKLVS